MNTVCYIRISSLESKSSHPMATALVAYCREQGVEPSAEVTQFQILEGQGILGFIDGHKIHVGNARMAGLLGWIQGTIYDLNFFVRVNFL